MGAARARVPRLKHQEEKARPRMRVREFLALFPRALWGTLKDDCIGHAKGAAYSALFSFFPLLATAATILIHVRANFIVVPITEFFDRVLPPGTQELVFNYFAVRGGKPVLLPVTAVLLSISAGSGATVSLMQGFGRIYRIPAGRPFVQERIIAIALLFSAVVPVIAASVLMLLGARAERAVGHWLGLLPLGAELRGWVSLVFKVARYLIALGSITFGATILYYFGPNRPQRWRRVWPGAVVATALWFGTTVVFSWYVRNIAHYNVMYGSIAAGILLLVWMYILALIAFIGCEFNAVYEKASGEMPQ